ncbi:MAG: hypothetical protein EXS08_05095 [Planctomycetes bacterium]|nr:hypothetical protein [Planctomycetota bacterium]
MAAEVARGRNSTAEFVLKLMRQYEDAFWKRKLEHPSAAKLEAYAKKAQKLREQDREARLELVKWAQRNELEEQAFTELRDLLLELDEPLVFEEGALVVAGARFKGALAERARKAAIEINGRPYMRDAFLQRVPDLTRIFEASSPELRVRSTTSVEEAERLHAAASALLPLLFEDFGGKPERRLQIAVLAERKTYDRYLDVTGLSGYHAADGFADHVAGTAVLCKEGSTEPYVLGLALHELTHLFQLSVSPAVFPSWFLEGSAETYGGEGVFRWDGATLETRGKMSITRLDELRAAPLALRDLLEGDARALLAQDKLAARRFYCESWAFLRYLREAADAEFAERLDRWRTMCFGSAAGADFDKPYQNDAASSRKLFLQLFEKDLPALEQGFASWLAAL